MLTIIFILAIVLLVMIISVIVLPIATILALPILLDAFIIILLVKLFGRRKDKKEGKKC